jgi:hypothetical protein
MEEMVSLDSEKMSGPIGVAQPDNVITQAMKMLL